MFFFIFNLFRTVCFAECRSKSPNLINKIISNNKTSTLFDISNKRCSNNNPIRIDLP